MQTTDRTATAYHEAGHAVIAYLQGCAFTRVTIVLPDGGCTWVRLRFNAMHPDFAPDTPRLRDAFEREAMVCIAGMLAHERYLGIRPAFFHYEDDQTIVETMLARMATRAAERRAYGRFLTERARSVLHLPPHWNAVHALASALLEVGSMKRAAAGRCIASAIDAEDAWRRGRRRRLA